jgi:ABC-type dipeptide/oligopeptide/nickel transport system permease subunit
MRAATLSRACGLALLAASALGALFASRLAPNAPDVPFPDRAYAPPMAVHVWSSTGPSAPYVFEEHLQDRLRREFVPGAAVPLAWFTDGRLVTLEAGRGPLLILGADALGRDVFARTLHGARLSLGVAALGGGGALLIGVLIGAWAAVLGGRWELWLMAAADFVLVLPAAYLILILRADLPGALSTRAVFLWMAAFFAVSGWPPIARGVRAILAAEQTAAYVEAARAAGAGRWRIIRRLLPAASGFLLVEVVLLFPAMLVAEVTVSLLGLGFPAPAVSWGTLLEDAASVRVFAEAPWLLAPAAALFVVVLALHLLAGPRLEGHLLTATSRNRRAAGVRTRAAVAPR